VRRQVFKQFLDCGTSLFIHCGRTLLQEPLEIECYVFQMTYPVDSRIRFRLYAGREVDGVIRAILQTTSGVRYRVDYGNGP
jgi:hypothetical protein